MIATKALPFFLLSLQTASGASLRGLQDQSSASCPCDYNSDTILRQIFEFESNSDEYRALNGRRCLDGLVSGEYEYFPSGSTLPSHVGVTYCSGSSCSSSTGLSCSYRKKFGPYIIESDRVLNISPEENEACQMSIQNACEQLDLISENELTPPPINYDNQYVLLRNVHSGRKLNIDSNGTPGAIISESIHNVLILKQVEGDLCQGDEEAGDRCFTVLSPFSGRRDLLSSDEYDDRLSNAWSEGIRTIEETSEPSDNEIWIFEHHYEDCYECFSLRNQGTGRRLFAQDGHDGTDGFGASNPMSETIYSDQRWEVTLFS